MMSAPAATYSPWIPVTTSGCCRFISSGQPPAARPRSCSMVPMAPSKIRIRWRTASRNLLTLFAPCGKSRQVTDCGLGFIDQAEIRRNRLPQVDVTFNGFDRLAGDLESNLPDMRKVDGQRVGQSINGQLFSLGPTRMAVDECGVEIENDQRILDFQIVQTAIGRQHCDAVLPRTRDESFDYPAQTNFILAAIGDEAVFRKQSTPVGAG